MGRPRKLDRRCRQLNISLTESEFAAIIEWAGGDGIQPVEYGRRVLLRRTEPVSGPLSLPSRFDHLAAAQLRRLGNLLNQLIRHLHSTGEPLPEAVGLLEELRNLLRSLP